MSVQADHISQRLAAYERRVRRVKLRTVDPRVAFVSLPHLCESWRSVPIDILYNCVLCLRARSWWFTQVETDQELLDVRHAFFPDVETLDMEIVEFVQLKNDKGLVLWLPPAGSDEDTAQECWQEVSCQLQCIRDPLVPGCVAGGRSEWTYSGLLLDPRFWERSFDHSQAVFCPDGKLVVAELLGSKSPRNVAPLMELLFQSNRTLLPMRAWSDAKWAIFYKHIASGTIARKQRHTRTLSHPTKQKQPQHVLQRAAPPSHFPPMPPPLVRGNSAPLLGSVAVRGECPLRRELQRCMTAEGDGDDDDDMVFVVCEESDDEGDDEVFEADLRSPRLLIE